MSDVFIFSQMIKTEAKKLGFFDCGIAKVRYLKEEKKSFEHWIKNGYNAGMEYMNKNSDKRLNPSLLVENAKSVIVVLLPYLTGKQQNPDSPKVSKYAYGTDYHIVLKEKLQKLYDYINKNIARINGRIFTDSAPVAEKRWAEIAGLGWKGKNSNIITKNGSFFFIGEIICDLELHYDNPATDRCGTCTKCIEACPTNAIVAPKVVNANLCISYHTIENKNEIPDFLKGKFENYIFGCDICQDVCPYNKKPVITDNPAFFPLTQILNFTLNDWQNISEQEYNTAFKNSPLKRTKYQGIKRNLKFLYDE